MNLQTENPPPKCPACGKPHLYRAPRTVWMRLLGVSRHYKCESCLRKYVRWLGSLFAA